MDDEQLNETDEWSWTVAPVIPGIQNDLWSKILAYDGEFFVSYVYWHEEFGKKGNLVFEDDVWLTDMWLSERGNLFLTSENGEVFRYSKKTWTTLRPPDNNFFSSIWGIDENNIFLSGEGFILSNCNSKWDFELKNLKLNIDYIKGRGQNEVWAVGRKGLVLSRKDNGWKRVDAPTNLDINAICFKNEREVFLACAEGLVLAYDHDKWFDFRFENIDFIDIIEFEGRIFIAGADRGLFCLDKNKIYPFKEDIHATRLSKKKGELFVSGDLGFYRFNGKKWDLFHYKLS